MDQTSANFSDAFDPMLALRAWRKRWVLTLATFVTISAMAGVATMQIKPKFESEASLYVRLGRESAGLDPTATTGEVAPIYETREQELNSALEVMQSRKLLEAVIAVIGEEAILDPTEFSFEQWQTSLAAAEWAELDPDVLHRSNRQKELAVEKVYKSISLEVEQSSNVIGVTSSAATPDLAQAITRTMLDAFQAEHVRLNQTHGVQFFQTHVDSLQGKLDAARLKLSGRKTELGIMSIEGERARLEDLLTAVEKQLHIAVPDLEGARASTKVIEREVKALPDRTQPHDATDTLKKKLHELEQKHGVLLTKFTPKHFRVRDVQAEIDLVKNQLVDPSNRNVANPTLRELEVALVNDRSKVALTAALIDKLQLQQSQLRKKLISLNDAEAEMLALKDSVDELKAASVKATAKLEEAQILDKLTQERISNIKVVQPPTFNPVSMSPSRSLVLAAGVVVGVIASLVLPAIVEFGFWYLNVLRSPREGDVIGGHAEGVVTCGG